jgi:hypothetical protein
VANALHGAMAAANAKMRRLAVFYCIVLVVFVPRAAYAGFLTYASSAMDSDCGDICNKCQPLPVLIYNWTLFNQEIPAIFYAFSSAMLTVVSVWFILTEDEKRLLRTGLAKAQGEGFKSLMIDALNQRVGLDSLL